KEAEANQIPRTLVDSMGNVLGKFVITRFEEKRTSSFPCGLPKKVEFNLSLRRYS
ncbi:phage tail protein, partial [Wolbachia endosymbiont of Atemnus politus]